MIRRPMPVRFYESTIASGNAYKVTLLMAQLGVQCPVTELDILARPSQTRLPEFLAKNANGRIPVVELDDGTCLAESNAILFYLAEDTPFWPSDSLQRAQVLQWMFFEQYSHEPYVAVLKFWHVWGGLHNKRPEELALLKDRGQQALAVMDTHLRERLFFVGERYTIADVALYAYTHSAALVGFELEALPALRAWLERIAAQPGHIRIKNGPGSSTWQAST